MKLFATVVKVMTALAAVAGAVYVVATYGDQIVAWAKKTLAAMPCPKCQKTEEVAEEVAEESAAEEPAEEVATEEPAEEVAIEIVVNEDEPVAEEADFEV